MRIAGIMSGTSLDGIDVAVIDTHGSQWKLVEFKSTPYPKQLKTRILAVSNCVTHTNAISRMNFELGERYASAVLALGTPVKSIDLIGCHGQTIFHERGNTLQIGEPAVIAERTGIPVISNFRPRDIAAGGQGAPLVPFVDYLLFKHRNLLRVALNIGGIANITILQPGCKSSDVVAFDTGPGNMIIDQLASIATKGKQDYDKGGKLFLKGKVNQPLLQKLLRDKYYTKPGPKSVGREQYGKEFVAKLIATQLDIFDLLATATVLTSATIAASILNFTGGRLDELIVAGGGAHNPHLMSHLAALLPGAAVVTSDTFGIPVDAKEAIAFALLARETWARRPANLPSATGASHPVILGTITNA